MNSDEIIHAIEALQQELHRLTNDIRELQHPQGRVFVATRDSDAGAFTEKIPKEDGSQLQALSNGRTAGAGDTGMTLIKLPAGAVPVLMFPNGPTAAYVDLSPPGCNPDASAVVTLGPEGEGSETANTTALNFIAGPGTGTGSVVLNVQTRTVYNDAGDQVLYGFERTLTFNCNGGNLVLQQVSSERRYTIDVPTDCS